ncbi:hypothetical protein O5O45_11400 [Hahella aquimaris]|uniref:hypothetical protein n=1 Tax=Hahella sp. HNIBRBA332 TaxID=3015983 RepID=UPI00273CA704|nr:hypothetical protein [Hahella sp. HNIBRBA332]WLQ16525.1 hypothetical protein O5O45_11400 [Hahella sp. HNIBRBA332]
MSKASEPLYCSEACKHKIRVRSFSACPVCKQIWDAQQPEGSRHYRNNVWKMCEACSLANHCCVVCGAKVDR